MEKDIWGDLANAKTPTIIETKKQPLTKENLMDYMSYTKTEEINPGTFFDYFDRTTIDKTLPGTENYLPHALFDMYFQEEKILALFQFIFDYISPCKVSKDHGLNYLMALFNRVQPLSDKGVITLFQQAREVGFDFSGRDYNWNTLLHWALIGNGYAGPIEKLYPYFDKDFYDMKNITCGYLSSNKQSINCYMLAVSLTGYLSKNNFIRAINHSSENYNYKCGRIDADLEKCQELYEKWYSWGKNAYLFQPLIHTTNHYGSNLRARLGFKNGILDDQFYNDDLSSPDRIIPALYPQKLKKMGSYKTKK